MCLAAAILPRGGRLSNSDTGQWFLLPRVFFCNCAWSSGRGWSQVFNRALYIPGLKTSLKAHSETIWTHLFSEAHFVCSMANRPALGKMCCSNFPVGVEDLTCIKYPCCLVHYQNLKDATQQRMSPDGNWAPRTQCSTCTAAAPGDDGGVPAMPVGAAPGKVQLLARCSHWSTNAPGCQKHDQGKDQKCWR